MGASVIITGRGGVGKTTVAANLAAYLLHRRYSLLSIEVNSLLPDLTLHIGSFTSLSNFLCMAHLRNTTNELIVKTENNGSHLRALKILKDNFDLTLIESRPSLGIVDILSAFETNYQIAVIELADYPLKCLVNDVLRLKQFGDCHGMETFVILNKANNTKEEQEKVKYVTRIANENNLHLLGVVPFSENIIKAYQKKIPILLYKPQSQEAKVFVQIGKLFEKLLKISKCC